MGHPGRFPDVLIRRYGQSPGMVIIEVDRYFDRFDSLLGNHPWASFLKYPTEEEQDKASKIFWCHYNSGRQVQKNGEPFRLKLASAVVLIWELIDRVEARRRRGTLVPGLESPQRVSGNTVSYPQSSRASHLQYNKASIPENQLLRCTRRGTNGRAIVPPSPKKHVHAPSP